jgi:Cu(I)/Ag(I) efflux system membrane fusion protein
MWQLLLAIVFLVGSFFAAGIILIVIAGVAQRAGWLQAGGSSSTAATEIHTCSMHPQIRQPGPGKCPICGMKLVPASSSSAHSDEFAITILPAQRRIANIRTATAILEPVNTIIHTIGAIQIDESRQATIASYIDGRVERMFADYTGVDVEQGDHLAVVYSPQLYTAQVEYLESANTLAKMSSGALAVARSLHEKLVANSRQKLIELGMTEDQLKTLEKSGKAESRLTIYAAIGGTVIQKLAEEGKFISAGEPIYRIANLSTVWLMLELYPEEASKIRFGQHVEAQFQSIPGEKLTGRVAFIAPTVNPSTRTVGVRVEFDNAERRLRPGDYAKATITIPIESIGVVYDRDLAGKWISPMHPQIVRDEPGDCPICGMKLVPTSRYGFSDQPVDQRKSLTIPRSAVLMAGAHSVIYVETEPGRFEIRHVTLGPILQERAIILSGLEPGEKVATSGNFLIDSQMQLEGKPSLIDPVLAIANQFRNTPLDFKVIKVEHIDGVAGEQLERLFNAYFGIQKTLASDSVPTQADVEELLKVSGKLNAFFATDEKQLTEAIAEHGQHLHHLSLEEARRKFKPLSHAVVKLATKVRGASSPQPFSHFFCPMVKQGEGDWLQADDTLLNPYYGTQMLHCGELVRTIPVGEGP